MKRLLIFSVFIFLLINKTHGDSDTLYYQSDSTNSNLIQNRNYSESINYQVLYDTQRDFNDKILSTVYWSLSSILIVILAIIGSNIYFNFRFNKKQYIELEKELKQRMKLLENSMLKEIDKNMNEFTKSSQKDISKYQSEIQEKLATQLKVLTENYNERLDSFSKNLKEQIETLKERLEMYKSESDDNNTNQKELVKILKEQLSQNAELAEHNLNQSVLEIKIDIEELEAEIWKSKEIFGNALTMYIKQSIHAIKRKWEWKLKYSLKNISEMLEKISYLSKYDVENFEELLPIIPDDYEIQKADIAKKIDSIPKINN